MKERTLEEEKAAIDQALDQFTNEMRARLHQKAEQGKRGWENRDDHRELSSSMLLDASDTFRGDYSHLIDIANYAMFLRQQTRRSGEKVPMIEVKP